MPKNKRPRKAHSNFKTLTDKYVDKYIKKLIFVATAATGSPAIPSFMQKPPSVLIQDMCIKTSFEKRTPKTAFLTKLCRNEKGIEYMAEPIEISLGNCFLADPITITEQGVSRDYDSISDWLTENLNNITHNKKHFIGDAYIIFHTNMELAEEDAIKVFSGIGGFNAKAEWET